MNVSAVSKVNLEERIDFRQTGLGTPLRERRFHILFVKAFTVRIGSYFAVIRPVFLSALLVFYHRI